MKSIITCPYCNFKEEIFANTCIESLKCKSCQKNMKAEKDKGCIINLYGSKKCPFE